MLGSAAGLHTFFRGSCYSRQHDGPIASWARFVGVYGAHATTFPWCVLLSHRDLHFDELTVAIAVSRLQLLALARMPAVYL